MFRKAKNCKSREIYEKKIAELEQLNRDQIIARQALQGALEEQCNIAHDFISRIQTAAQNKRGYTRDKLIEFIDTWFDK